MIRIARTDGQPRCSPTEWGLAAALAAVYVIAIGVLAYFMAP